MTPPFDVGEQAAEEPPNAYPPAPRSTASTSSLSSRFSGRLSGVYNHYLLVRPYPSLRILFASPSQRVPGILQSPFMNKIGGSNRVREELTAALADGRGQAFAGGLVTVVGAVVDIVGAIGPRQQLKQETRLVGRAPGRIKERALRIAIVSACASLGEIYMPTSWHV